MPTQESVDGQTVTWACKHQAFEDLASWLALKENCMDNYL